MQKQYRLKKRASFNYIYKNGKKVSSQYLNLIYVPANFSFRIGFAVSKKIGNSVTRNKIKRRLKEICRLHLRIFMTGNNYIFVAKPGIENLKFEDLYPLVEKLLKKAKLFVTSNQGEKDDK